MHEKSTYFSIIYRIYKMFAKCQRNAWMSASCVLFVLALAGGVCGLVMDTWYFWAVRQTLHTNNFANRTYDFKFGLFWVKICDRKMATCNTEELETIDIANGGSHKTLLY